MVKLNKPPRKVPLGLAVELFFRSPRGLISLALGLISLFLVVFLGFGSEHLAKMLRAEYDLRQSSENISATVIDCRTRHKRAGPWSFLEFSYEVQDKIYHGVGWVRGEGFEYGTEITILVSPENPRSAKIPGTKPYTEGLGFFLFALGSFVGSLSIVYLDREKWAASQTLLRSGNLLPFEFKGRNSLGGPPDHERVTMDFFFDNPDLGEEQPLRVWGSARETPELGEIRWALVDSTNIGLSPLCIDRLLREGYTTERGEWDPAKGLIGWLYVLPLFLLVISWSWYLIRLVQTLCA